LKSACFTPLQIARSIEWSEARSDLIVHAASRQPPASVTRHHTQPTMSLSKPATDEADKAAEAMIEMIETTVKAEAEATRLKRKYEPDEQEVLLDTILELTMTSGNSRADWRTHTRGDARSRFTALWDQPPLRDTTHQKETTLRRPNKAPCFQMPLVSPVRRG
jgi:hypothetical protein